MKDPVLVASLRLLHNRFGGPHFKAMADRLEGAYEAFLATPEAEQLAALNGAWAAADRMWKTSMKRAAPALLADAEDGA